MDMETTFTIYPPSGENGGIRSIPLGSASMSSALLIEFDEWGSFDITISNTAENRDEAALFLRDVSAYLIAVADGLEEA